MLIVLWVVVVWVKSLVKRREMRAYQRELEQGFRLGDLPPEMMERVLSYLNYTQLAHMRTMNRSLNEQCRVALNKGFAQIENRIRKYLEEEVLDIVSEVEGEGGSEEEKKVKYFDELNACYLHITDMRYYSTTRRMILINEFWFDLVELGLTYHSLAMGQPCFIAGQLLDEALLRLKEAASSEFVDTYWSNWRYHSNLDAFKERCARAKAHFLSTVIASGHLPLDVINERTCEIEMSVREVRRRRDKTVDRVICACVGSYVTFLLRQKRPDADDDIWGAYMHKRHLEETFGRYYFQVQQSAPYYHY